MENFEMWIVGYEQRETFSRIQIENNQQMNKSFTILHLVPILDL